MFALVLMVCYLHTDDTVCLEKPLYTFDTLQRCNSFLANSVRGPATLYSQVDHPFLSIEQLHGIMAKCPYCKGTGQVER